MLMTCRASKIKGSDPLNESLYGKRNHNPLPASGVGNIYSAAKTKMWSVSLNLGLWSESMVTLEDLLTLPGQPTTGVALNFLPRST